MNKVLQKIQILTENFLFNNCHRYNSKSIYIRIISIFCLINTLSLFPDTYNLYSENGLIQKNVNAIFTFAYYPQLTWLITSMYWLGIARDTSLYIIISFYLMSNLFIVLNYNRLIFSILCWLIHLMIINSNYFVSYGADYFISYVSFMLIFLCLDSIVSTLTDKIIYSFIIRFLQIHLAIVYFFSGFGKILGTDWFDGNAVWYVFNTYNSSFSKYISGLRNYPIFFEVLGWLIVSIEILYPLLVLNSKTRKIVLVMVIIMHIGIGILMSLYTFAAIMILLNIIAFGQCFYNKKVYLIT